MRLTLFLLLLLLLLLRSGLGGGGTTSSGGSTSGADVGQELLDVLALESLYRPKKNSCVSKCIQYPIQNHGFPFTAYNCMRVLHR